MSRQALYFGYPLSRVISHPGQSLVEFKDNLYSSPMSDARASAHANRPDTRMGEDGSSHCREHTQCFIRNPE